MEMYQAHIEGPFAASGITNPGHLPKLYFIHDSNSIEVFLTALSRPQTDAHPLDTARSESLAKILKSGDEGTGQYMLFTAGGPQPATTSHSSLRFRIRLTRAPFTSLPPTPTMHPRSTSAISRPNSIANYTPIMCESSIVWPQLNYCVLYSRTSLTEILRRRKNSPRSFLARTGILWELAQWRRRRKMASLSVRCEWTAGCRC
ncbi:hypothetical protein BDV95DRAFT_567553 [Massariosphaeria phaeospora]|uniref:Uncharacterized protein n=1 Tax=Massariosphaeria phaeospora TaxID=100035 RepID=A0A7C8MS48_9PLEO|nr:hypothetical protein BDV95DRAFT_567553 [Massariosphaeria phaeospora]